MEDISKIHDTHWDIGQQRAEIIRALAAQQKCSKQSILEAATELNLSTRYIYRLIRYCRASEGLLTSLIPSKSAGGRGKPRLSQHQESLICNIIDSFYLTPQKLSPSRIVEEVRKQCAEKMIKVPSEATI